MTPEGWTRVKEIFDAALDQSPEKREKFLAEACGGDESLRGEVNRLLAEHDQAGDFLNHPAWPQAVLPTSTTEHDVQGARKVISPPGSPAASLKAGETFADRYEIKDELGRGGFGIVYSAFDRGPLQRTVALKVIRFASGGPAEPSALARQRFLEEARVAGNLSHSNIATVYDVGESAGCVYMTQELAPGRDLRKILGDAGPLPLRRIVAIGRQICEGLAHAHARNIVHRDIKPGNIVVGAEDRVKVTDFGLAQPPQGEDSALNQAIAGTPGYMAPEQLRGERVDGRADIFAVGCVLYQMLTGRQPFEGATPASIIEKTLHAVPTEPSRVREDLPRTLDRIVGRAMRKDPDERYANITQLQQDLVNYDQFEYVTETNAAAEEIAGALESRRCTLFLGLRLPVSLDEKPAQTVEQFIAQYLAERLTSPTKEHSISRLARDLEMERGRSEMLRYLTTAVRNPSASPREIVRRVARLPFRAIVATGYDTFLETELAKVGRKFRCIRDCQHVPQDPAEPDLLVRLFGSVESEASIVVTEEDLWNFFGEFDSLSDALKSAFGKHNLVFIGYDAEDEGFRRLFAEIARLRADLREGCYLVAADTALPAIHWAQRKGPRLVDAEPGSFLSVLDEALVERRRQKGSPQKETSESEPDEAPKPAQDASLPTVLTRWHRCDYGLLAAAFVGISVFFLLWSRVFPYDTVRIIDEAKAAQVAKRSLEQLGVAGTPQNGRLLLGIAEYPLLAAKRGSAAARRYLEQGWATWWYFEVASPDLPAYPQSMVSVNQNGKVTAIVSVKPKGFPKEPISPESSALATKLFSELFGITVPKGGLVVNNPSAPNSPSLMRGYDYRIRDPVTGFYTGYYVLSGPDGFLVSTLGPLSAVEEFAFQEWEVPGVAWAPALLALFACILFVLRRLYRHATSWPGLAAAFVCTCLAYFSFHGLLVPVAGMPMRFLGLTSDNLNRLPQVWVTVIDALSEGPLFLVVWVVSYIVIMSGSFYARKNDPTRVSSLVALFRDRLRSQFSGLAIVRGFLIGTAFAGGYVVLTGLAERINWFWHDTASVARIVSARTHLLPLDMMVPADFTAFVPYGIQMASRALTVCVFEGFLLVWLLVVLPASLMRRVVSNSRLLLILIASVWVAAGYSLQGLALYPSGGFYLIIPSQGLATYPSSGFYLVLALQGVFLSAVYMRWDLLTLMSAVFTAETLLIGYPAQQMFRESHSSLYGLPVLACFVFVLLGFYVCFRPQLTSAYRQVARVFE